MSENEIKPVAWTIDEQLEKVNSGRIGFIAIRDLITPAADVPLYDQSAIDRLTAERDAAVADAERYRWLRVDTPVSAVPRVWQSDDGAFPVHPLHLESLDEAIDAARAEGGV